MAQISFGTILQNERERKGLDIPSVGRRLRIRPDILQAIEESDFARMPPRGYARNMVNAYARYLGLNPTEITRMYLDEVYADQVKRARSTAQPTGFDMGRDGSRRKGGNAAASKTPREHHAGRAYGTNNAGRVLLVDSNTSRYRDLEEERAAYDQPERTHRSTRSAVPGTQYTNFYAGPSSNGGGIRSKLPLIIGGAVILVLLIVLLVFLFGPKPDAGDDAARVPVTGVDNPAQTDGTTTPQETTPEVTAPTQALLTWEIAAGESAYVEVFVDNMLQAELTGTLEAGRHELPVTTVAQFVTTSPDVVTVTVDGAPVVLVDENSRGVYSYTVDFPAILTAWNQANPSATTPPPTTPDSTGGTTPEGGTTTADTPEEDDTAG